MRLEAFALLLLLTCCAFCVAQDTPITSPEAAVLRDGVAVLNFDEIGFYAVGYAYRGKAEVRYLADDTGDMEAQTGVWCRMIEPQQGKRAWLLHCPWRNGTGIAFQEFVVALPQCRSITLRGAIAMRDQGTEKSDGATFRLFVAGKKLIDVHRKETTWVPHEFNLTEYAGQTVTIRYETDPGPHNDPSFDFSLWGARELLLDGYTPPSANAPAPPPLELSTLSLRTDVNYTKMRRPEVTREGDTTIVRNDCDPSNARRPSSVILVH